MSPKGLTDALPKGGTMMEEYSAKLDNYIDGLLIRNWISKQKEGADLSASSNVSKSVCWSCFHF
jgi:hypothetical protein